MVLSLLGFALVQALVWGVARHGGAQCLRGALAAFGEISGVSDVVVFSKLGTPAQLRIATVADDVFEVPPLIVADWLETGRRGSWHVALAFAGDRCIGISQRNFQPVTGASGAT